jgi:hypothetical protein
MVVGVVLAVPLYAAEAAGDILDLQRGSSSATLSDPLGSSQSAITGTLLALVVIAEGEGQISTEVPVDQCVTAGVKLDGPNDVASGIYLAVPQSTPDANPSPAVKVIVWSWLLNALSI